VSSDTLFLFPPFCLQVASETKVEDRPYVLECFTGVWEAMIHSACSKKTFPSSGKAWRTVGSSNHCREPRYHDEDGRGITVHDRVQKLNRIHRLDYEDLKKAAFPDQNSSAEENVDFDP